MKQTLLLLLSGLASVSTLASDLQTAFQNPPESARPWVYWYFMDGNMTREGMTADLEAMKRAGIGGVIFLEVNIGIPRGPVEFMSPEWQQLLKHAVSEADRLGQEFALGSGPGWCGTGGPWVKPEQSMQYLVASSTNLSGPIHYEGPLPRPQPRTPFFGAGTLTPPLAKQWKEFYQDVAVLAFPTPDADARLSDVDEKALYQRAPYSSQRGVKPFLPAPAEFPALPAGQCVANEKVLDLSSHLTPEGSLAWNVPAGNWTVLRFGRTLTGQTTRPAPAPGLGFESDKFSRAALDAHFEAFTEKLLQTIQPRKIPGRGLTLLHFDSWEMSSQNWSEDFRKEFKKCRGYDPLPYLPVFTGRVVGSAEVSERFLWDLRQTAQELVVANHALRLKELARRHGLGLSLEPYDMNPCADLELGKVADVPQCEFWSKGHGFSTEYSCIEAASIAHTMGRPIVAAEAFTAEPGEDWTLYPGAMKAQADWALCCGINRLIFHRYQHQPWLDRWPGMTMGPYGVHWERTQTWWDMAGGFHTYLSRCQELLRRGLPVADILYLAPEGAPMVFRPPASALDGDLPDRRGYNFDACAPSTLIERAGVKRNRIVFPDGMSYRLLVLPQFETMTPTLLRKLRNLVESGATVMGSPPRQSPSLSDYPKCDEQVRQLAKAVWGPTASGGTHTLGKGQVIYTAEHDLPGKRTPSLQGAKWIWYPEGSPAASAPVGTRFFKKMFVLEPNRRLASAQLAVSADNAFRLQLNGKEIASGNNFHDTAVAEVSKLLNPGTNTLTAKVENGGPAPNPAGFICALSVDLGNGEVASVATDSSWLAAQDQSGQWRSALELGPWNMAPWNKTAADMAFPEIYPPYPATARVLSDLGVPPDFESGASLRYIHRHDSAAEIYFVANREERAVTTSCKFRVTGLAPEWWNPVTGESKPLPAFTKENGVTTIPLHFEPLESAFIMFRKASQPAQNTGKNFLESETVTTVSNAWDVSFDPKWGGPEKLTMTQLQDWTERPEPGVKYYSGKAVYRTRFDVPKPERLNAASRLVLSLGDVKNMASVTLNGKNLGVVWCSPWQIPVPRSLLRENKNELEITVANLWPNRMIGDQFLPADKRLCWSTRYPFTTNSPLLPSGLKGPVTLRAAGLESEWAFIDNGQVRLGVLRSSGGGIAWFSDSNSERNLINHWDRGRLVQQSYYGKPDGSFWDKQPWSWNPVQGGDWRGSPAKLLELRVGQDWLYARTLPKHWASGADLTDTLMEQWITLTGKVARVHYRFSYNGQESHPKRSQEIPAFFVTPELDTLVLYGGTQPWTGEPISRSKPGWPNESRNPTERWAAYVGNDDVGVGAFVPVATGLTCYRFGDGQANHGACSYFAPLVDFAITPGLVFEYDVYITTGSSQEIRERFQRLRQLPMPGTSALKPDSVPNGSRGAR